MKLKKVAAICNASVCYYLMVEQMGRFLVEAALKKEGLTAKITPVKRGPGDPILTIVPPETAGKSASA